MERGAPRLDSIGTPLESEVRLDPLMWVVSDTGQKRLKTVSAVPVTGLAGALTAAAALTPRSGMLCSSEAAFKFGLGVTFCFFGVAATVSEPWYCTVTWCRGVGALGQALAACFVCLASMLFQVLLQHRASARVRP